MNRSSAGGTAPSAGHIYLAWTSFQRRQVSMAEHVGFECLFMPRSPAASPFATLLDYCRLFVKTLGELRQRRPATVWVQLPQVPLLWAALVARRLWLPSMRVVADCHNAMFRPPWSRFPFGLRLLHRCNTILVHNTQVMASALEFGLPEHRTLVLEDVPPAPRTSSTGQLPAALSTRPHPWVLFPGSFSPDEPIAEILRAAELAPEVTFIITGRPERAARHGFDVSNLPSNVVLSGYLELSSFEAVLRDCDVVLALTKVDGIQLSVCNEALGFGKAMVISNTSLLRRLFGDAAELALDHSPQALVAAVRRALEQKHNLESRASLLVAERLRQWREDQFSRVIAAR